MNRCALHFAVAGLVSLAATAGRADDNALAAPTVDLRPQFEKFRLAVRQQGQRGACQVFAMVGVIEYQLAGRGKPLELSEQFIMWAANQANGLTRTDGFNPDLLIAGLKW